MNEEKKVRVQLEKHLWPDEVLEIKRKKRSKMITVILALALFCSGLMIGVKLTSNQTSLIGTSNSSSTNLSKLDSVYNILKNKWYFAQADEELKNELIDNAIKGMATSDQDLHTYYMSPNDLSNFTTSIDMGFVGIGVQYNSSDGTKLITRVFHNSPAEKAGVLPGDIIYRVDGVLCEDLSSDEIAGMVRGVEGTDVEIELLRDNEIITLIITRGAVQNSAFGKMLESDIGYLQIYQFGSTTADEAKGYLEMMSEQGLRQLIIDLRDDGGGYLGALVDIASLFLPDGTVAMKQVYADDSIQLSKTHAGNFTNIENIVILINGNTASAAEVLTLALKEQRNDVTTVGTLTYGKGTVQVTHSFSDGSALKYTTSKWLSPNDIWVNGVGITPDQTVELHEILYMYSFMLDEDRDPIGFDEVDNAVKLVQNALDFLGYDVKRMDGYFDQSTVEAITKFQKEFNITNLGKIDNETLEVITAQVTKIWALDESVDTQLQAALEILR